MTTRVFGTIKGGALKIGTLGTVVGFHADVSGEHGL
jgi:hypothetical protein